jgi:hypothetical protein
MAIADKLIAKHKVDYIAAYNSNFDMGHISKMCKEQKVSNPFEKMPVFCIWGGVQDTLAKQRSFIKFAFENSFTTPTGLLSTGAETLARYLFQNPEFVEEHTGLADNQIEVQILDRVLRQKKPLSKKSGHWARMKGVGVGV